MPRMAYRVVKMAYPTRDKESDKTRIILQRGHHTRGYPQGRSHEYQLGPRSALDWLIDRYQVTYP